MINKILTFALIAGILPVIFAACGSKNKDAENKEQPATVQNIDTVKKKILIVVTSHEQLGKTGKKTGYYLSEVAHPWHVLKEGGYDIDIVSPQGGKAPADPNGFDLNDSINKLFWEDKVYNDKIVNTAKPTDIDPTKYAAILYAGGHGTMWDFADNTELAQIAAKIYENGGIVAAVCHGPSALVNIKLSDGKYLVDGKKVNGFTNEEEKQVKLEKVVPSMLESKLVERGGIFEKSAPFTPHVTVDQRLITGQNPQSATGVGEAILKELSAK